MEKLLECDWSLMPKSGPSSKIYVKTPNNSFSWSLRDNTCWAAISHVFCTVISLSVQSAGTRDYCLSNSEFNKTLNLFDKFVA